MSEEDDTTVNKKCETERTMTFELREQENHFIATEGKRRPISSGWLPPGFGVTGITCNICPFCMRPITVVNFSVNIFVSTAKSVPWMLTSRARHRLQGVHLAGPSDEGISYFPQMCPDPMTFRQSGGASGVVLALTRLLCFSVALCLLIGATLGYGASGVVFALISIECVMTALGRRFLTNSPNLMLIDIVRCDVDFKGRTRG